jgi:hypothetical protein
MKIRVYGYRFVADKSVERQSAEAACNSGVAVVYFRDIET